MIISIQDGLHEFETYRKDTLTEIIIHGSTCCLLVHKFAIFKSLTHRLTHIFLNSPAFQKDLVSIKHLIRVSDINVDVEWMILDKKIIRKCLDSTTSLVRSFKRRKNKRWVTLPFLDKVSSKLNRVLRPFGFHPAYHNPVAHQSCLIDD